MGIGWGEDPIHDRVGTKKVPSITGSVGGGGGKGGGREIPCMTELGPKKFHLSQGQWEEAEGRGREGDPIHDRVGTKKVPSITGSVGGGGGKGGGREIPYMIELGPKKFHLSQGQWEEAEGRGEGGRSHTWQSWDQKSSIYHRVSGRRRREGGGREIPCMAELVIRVPFASGFCLAISFCVRIHTDCADFSPCVSTHQAFKEKLKVKLLVYG